MHMQQPHLVTRSQTHRLARRGVRPAVGLAVAFAVLLLGCGRWGFDPVSITAASTPDGSVSDASLSDANVGGDGSVSDAGPDGSTADAGSEDGGTQDSGMPDGGMEDGGMPPPPPPPVGNLRSIGTNTGVLYSSGVASISAGSAIVTFSGGASLPTNVGSGDELQVGGETFYVYQRDSANQVTVQQQASASHNNEPYTFRRAFNSLQAWEDARDGDLVAEDRIEVGIAYNDGPFMGASEPFLEFLGATSDVDHYMRLQAAAGHEHGGIAGVGVVLDGGGSGQTAINIESDYVQIAGLELHGFGNGVGGSIRTQSLNILLDRLLVHDMASHCIRNSTTVTSTVTIRNSVIYNCADKGIRGHQPASTMIVQNCTVFNTASDGVAVVEGTINVTNTIAMNSGGNDFDQSGGSLIQSYNVSSDSTAGGTGSLINRLATSQFVSIASGSEDLHLRATADAVDSGSALPSFSDDVDGDLRPRGSGWDIGADEQ